jgi:hypothetical protein
MSMQVTHRPVVALVDGGPSTEQRSEITEEAPKAHKAEPEEAVAKLSSKESAPLTKDGVRFSQAFRPA